MHILEPTENLFNGSTYTLTSNTVIWHIDIILVILTTDYGFGMI